MPTIERQISQNGDDGYITCYAGGEGYKSSETSFMVGRLDGAWNKLSAWLLLRNLPIPPGSTIDAAKLRGVCETTFTKVYVKTRIEAVDEDNPSPPTDAPDYKGRARTAAYIYWDNLPPWTAGQVIDSPDFKAVIQEIIDREGWLEGNNIMIYWQDCEGRTTQENVTCRRLYAREGSTTKAIKLIIDYTPPITEPQIETQDATGIKSDEAMLHTKVIDDREKTLSIRHNWGKTTAYGENTPWQEGKHTNDVISQKIIDLDPETEYHFRGEAVFED